MKRLASLAAAAALCAATLAPAPATALSDEQKAALAALAIIGIGIAAASQGHGHDHDSTSQWDEGRYGEPFSPSNGIVCLPVPRQCYQDGMISWRWTRRIFGS